MVRCLTMLLLAAVPAAEFVAVFIATNFTKTTTAIWTSYVWNKVFHGSLTARA